eukprot:GHVR01026125.1.p1 GENE.GHVR01026125.1~~GHVR01026125.1.p1  ORF type:complete len:140 (+),score=14.89 GHVR01026125.1:2-421(+)
MLLEANVAGLLSVASQPGRPFSPGHDGRAWAGRAFVGGFAEDNDWGELRQRAQRAGLIALVERAGPAADAFSMPVGLRDGTPYLLLESGARSAELEIFEAQIGASAYACLSACSLVWLVDPVWGRRSRLEQLFTAHSDV